MEIDNEIPNKIEEYFEKLLPDYAFEYPFILKNLISLIFYKRKSPPTFQENSKSLIVFHFTLIKKGKYTQ